MNKFLTTVALVLGSLLPMQAAEMIFGYCGDIRDNNVGGNNSSYYIGGAIELPVETLKKFEGDVIKAVNVGFGESKQREITLFFTNDFYDQPVYEEKALCAKKNDWNLITLEKPFVIDNVEKPLYIGYYLRMFSDADYPISIDDSSEPSEYGCYFALSASKGGLYESFYKDKDFGNVLLRLVIEGDNLPTNDARPLKLEMPNYVRPDKAFDVEFTLYNQGSNDINDIDASFTIGGNTFERHIVFDKPVEGGTSAVATLKDLVCSEEGPAVSYMLTIPTVNGIENLSNETAINGYVASSSVAFERAFVVEEGTGTWCANCPRGIVAMRYMEETYGNKGFIGIAVHGNDDMSAPTYSPVESMFFPQYPMCTINRTISCDPSKDILENAYKIYNTIAFAKVHLEISYEGEHPEAIEVKATTEFAADYDNIDYALAFVLTENNVGPYVQLNNYTTGVLGTLEGIPDEKAYSTTFDEVARYILGWNGIPESSIKSARFGDKFVYETSVPAKTVKDVSQMSVIALLLNRKTTTYEIVNACKVKPGEFISSEPDAVNIVEADNSDAPVEYYNLQGIRVDNPSNGIFIRRQGSKTTKVRL